MQAVDLVHGISHGLGLAVHDQLQSSFGDGTYKVGDVFTIATGIYISTHALDVLPDTQPAVAKVRATVRKYENTLHRTT